MWRDGERKLEAGKQLDKELLAQLIHEDQKVLRIVDGQQFEFRHDQMRAYLAARWAAWHETNPIGLFESESAIWRLSRTEQDEVWNFFADMYVDERPEDAIALWKWSTDHPDRAILQHALQTALRQAGLDPLMATAVHHPGAKPLGIAAPAGGKADDLKLIKGIGPQNEGRLNSLGIWHFAQIAAWSGENIKWVGSYLAFPGRIDREKWIDQARKLATAHKAEVSRRFGS
jgi:predicted flap endonuclease-1-like 5' DNA nuclease